MHKVYSKYTQGIMYTNVGIKVNVDISIVYFTFPINKSNKIKSFLINGVKFEYKNVFPLNDIINIGLFIGYLLLFS